jgi:hypothetical protein
MSYVNGYNNGFNNGLGVSVESGSDSENDVIDVIDVSDVGSVTESLDLANSGFSGNNNNGNTNYSSDDENGDEQKEDIRPGFAAPSAPPMPSSFVQGHGAGNGWLVPSASASAQLQSSGANMQPKVEKADDSLRSFGDGVVPSFGQGDNAPEIPMAIPVDNSEYEKYLKSRQITQRRSHPQHQKLHDFLQHGNDQDNDIDRQSNVKMSDEELADLIIDIPSNEFKNKVISALNSVGPIADPIVSSFVGNFTWHKEQEALNYPIYKEQEIRASNNAGVLHARYDELDIMSRESRGLHGRESWSVKPTKTVATGDFVVIQNNATSGISYQIWSGGNFRSLDWASVNQEGGRTNNKLTEVFSGQLSDTLNRVTHMPNMFTIVNIMQGEIGFCVNNADNNIMQMVPGRYFINESDYSFIGKDFIQNADITKIRPHVNNPRLNELASWIKVVSIPQGQVGFISDGSRTYRLDANTGLTPYVIVDRQVGFLGYANTNKPIVRSPDNKYARISLQPGQFVLFSSDRKDFIWRYEDQLALPGNKKYIDLVEPFCQFNDRIHDTSENFETRNNLSVINLSPLNFAVIRDNQNKVRIIEGSNNKLSTLLLRAPYEFLEMQNKNTNIYQNHGISRVRVSKGNWAAVNNIESGGKLEFYPSLLSNDPYYFDGQKRQFLQTVNINTPGEVNIEVPNIGKVSIVNLRSDEIGLANISNGVCLLRPRFGPYVFVPPMRYIRTEKTNEPIITEGDLHRVVLDPTQRAAIAKDGVYQLLELDKPGQDNCWIFRSNNFKFYGPSNKTDKDYELGTQRFVRVDPGEVGYYVGQNGTEILDVGPHVIDNAKGDNWEGFYPTSVEPLEVTDIEVTSQEGIKLHLDVLVTYSIADPVKTISRFGKDHDQLEKYMQDNTMAEMLRLCGGQPAIGNNKFNISGQDGASTQSGVGSNKELEDKIEKDFKEHQENLVAEYGIHIEHMKILKWSPDPEFMGKMKEQALQLQEQQASNAKAELERQNALKSAEAANLQAKLDLESQKIESERALLQKQNEIKMQNLTQESKAEQSRIQAVAEAKKEAEIQAAKAEAQAKAQESKARADSVTLESQARASAKSQELAAEAKVKVAQQDKETLTINSQAQKEQAVLAAEAEVASQSAKQVAEASAKQQIAQSEKDSAQLGLDTAEIKARQRVVDAKADAEVKALEAQCVASLKEAEVAGIPQEYRGQILALKIMADASKHIAENNKLEVVQHVTDPSQLNNIMGNAMGGAQTMQMMQMFMQGCMPGSQQSYGGANNSAQNSQAAAPMQMPMQMPQLFASQAGGFLAPGVSSINASNTNNANNTNNITSKNEQGKGLDAA